MKGLCLIALLSVIGCARPPSSSGAGSTTAIEHVTVLPMDGARVLPNHTVLLRDSLIVAVHPSGGANVPAGARRLDGRGMYVMPGLADMHIHLRGEGDLLSFLVHGVTTVFNLGGAYPEAPDLLRYRDEIESGARLGPSLYTSGPLLDGQPPIFASTSEPAGTPDEARAVVERQKTAGYDLVKTYNRLTPDAFLMAVSTAHELGIAIGGHLPERMDIADALATRLTLIAHGSSLLDWRTDSSGRQIDPSRLSQRVSLAKAAGTTVIPNLIYSATFAAALTDTGAAFRHPEARFVEQSVVDGWRRTPAPMLLRWNSPPSITYPALQQLARALDSAGVPILVGSDVPAMPGLFPGASTLAEIRELERAGLARYRALAAATANAGDFVQRHVDEGVRFGRVRPGYRADLIVLRRNPLEDLGALDHLEAVVVRGRWMTHAELLHRRSR